MTQASRDRGVDALVFDPDPVRGGKYVIQAKRYTTTVDVSAVRDLYGTVLNGEPIGASWLQRAATVPTHMPLLRTNH